MTRTRLLVAENHLGMRQRIVEVLERKFDVIGTVGDGLALVEAAARMKPDLCVIDISMPSLSGIEAAIELKKGRSDVKLIFSTVHEDPDFVRAPWRPGRWDTC